MIGAIAIKECKVLGRSPLTWIALAVLQIVFAWIFLLALEDWLLVQDKLASSPTNSGATAWLIDRCFTTAATVLMALSPLLTMRLLADERRTSGIELLLSSPVSAWQIVAGKCLAASLLYLMVIVQLTVMFLALLPFAPIDIGALGAAIVGLSLLGCACCAIGVYFSALSRQAAVSALGTFGTLFLLWILGISSQFDIDGGGLLGYLSITAHLQGFFKGTISTADAAYFVVLVAVFLALAIRHIDNLRSAAPGASDELARQIGFCVALVAIAGLFAWAAQRHEIRLDTTAQGRHSLSAQSLQTLESMNQALHIEAWLEPHTRTRNAITEIVQRYRTHKDDIVLSFANPQTQPARARELAVHPGGELILRYAGREQRTAALSERALTHAMLRLLHQSQPVIRYVQGHLERPPDSNTRHGFGQFNQYLRALGYQVDSLSLITQPVVPADTDVLVVAAPTGDYFPGEAASVLNYIIGGGNLLWLLEPQAPVIPAELAGELGLSVLPGVIVDAASQQLAVDTPDFAVLDQYPEHPALPDRLQVTLFPQAAGLEFPATVGWHVEPLLTTGPSSWTERGVIAGTISHDAEAGERAGPITLGAAFTRNLAAREQRVVVVGDADFLANGWLGNGGNKFLGQQLFNWLGGQLALPAIAPLQAQDTQILLSKRAIAAIGLSFLLVIPSILILVAILTWRRSHR